MTDTLTEGVFANVLIQPFEDSTGVYAIQMAYPIGLRYIDEGRWVTAFFDPQFERRRWARFLPSSLGSLTSKHILHVDLNRPLKWNDERILPDALEALALRRIERFLTDFGSTFVIHRTQEIA